MLRLAALAVLELAANAFGLLVAAWTLPGFSMSVLGFVVSLAIFTVAKVTLGPLVSRLSSQYVPALSGGVALVTTFLGLLIAALLTNGVTISGLVTWVLATLIVWLFGVLAAIVLPLFLFRSVLAEPEPELAEPQPAAPAAQEQGPPPGI